MKNLYPNDLEEVMTILLKRMRKGNVEPFFYARVFDVFSDFRNDICDAILEDDSKIEASHLVPLKSMYEKDETLMTTFLDKLCEKNRIKSTVKEKIKGSE